MNCKPSARLTPLLGSIIKKVITLHNQILSLMPMLKFWEAGN